jgi:DUF2914 family protein
VAASTPAPGQVGGVVVDDSGRPQSNATVDLRGRALRYRRATDPHGRFLFFEFHGTERVWLQAFLDSALSRRTFVNPPDTTVTISVSPMRDGTLRLAEAYLTRKVENRTAEVAIRCIAPVCEMTFPPDIGRVLLFLRVTGARPGSKVRTVWYWQGKEMARVPLTVNGPNFRTWSSKRILPQWKGQWWVDILSEGGRLLDVRFFTIAST